MYFYNQGFYPDKPAGADGAVYLTENTYQKLLEGQAAGATIVVSDKGRPVLSWPDLDALRQRAGAKIDAETDAKILTGFVFRGHRFWLTLENQHNLKSECDLRHTLLYPLKIKTQDGYLTIDCPADYLALYAAAVKFIRGVIEDGWARKDSLAGIKKITLEKIVYGQ